MIDVEGQQYKSRGETHRNCAQSYTNRRVGTQAKDRARAKLFVVA